MEHRPCYQVGKNSSGAAFKNMLVNEEGWHQLGRDGSKMKLEGKVERMFSEFRDKESTDKREESNGQMGINSPSSLTQALWPLWLFWQEYFFLHRTTPELQSINSENFSLIIPWFFIPPPGGNVFKEKWTSYGRLMPPLEPGFYFPVDYNEPCLDWSMVANSDRNSCQIQFIEKWTFSLLRKYLSV